MYTMYTCAHTHKKVVEKSVPSCRFASRQDGRFYRQSTSTHVKNVDMSTEAVPGPTDSELIRLSTRSSVQRYRKLCANMEATALRYSPYFMQCTYLTQANRLKCSQTPYNYQHNSYSPRTRNTYEYAHRVVLVPMSSIILA